MLSASALSKPDALRLVRERLRKPAWKWPLTVIAVAFVLLALNDVFVYESVLIPSTSMEPAILPNERLFLAKLPYRTIRRSDVVVINSRRLKERIAKRVIGLPGERVRSGAREIQLGPDEYFVLGDNRLASRDSRVIGPITRAEIEGKLEMVWYSFDLEHGRLRWDRIFHRVN